MSILLPFEYGRVFEQNVLSQSSVVLQARLKLKELLSSRLSSFTCSIVEKYYRKAIRTGAWSKLSNASRALLKATMYIPLVKSSVLRNILLDIFTEIELYTTWGKAVFYGVIIALRNGLMEALENTRRLVTLGVSYMNLPPFWRILS